MNYELVCGLETHVELSTKTKLFCACSASFGGKANSHCCPVCTGMPGALPVLNRTAVAYAVRAALALHAQVSEVFSMDRKHYFYPDLPKAYQISQYDEPIARGGYLELDGGKRIGIERIQIEEDAGKLVHEGGVTLVDYNRCGVPLIEIVTKPELSSAEEVKEYLEKLRMLMRYVGISDCKMQEGSMRSDVNVSVRKEGETALGTRTEIKNMTAPSFIVKAVEYERRRQTERLERGERIEQATLRYNESDGTTSRMREKESGKDYRFFPEPDVLSVRISKETVEKIQGELPELPDRKYRRYVEELGLNQTQARLIYPYQNVASYFENVVALGASAKITANLIVGIVFSSLKTEEEKENFSLSVSAEEFALLVSYVEEGKMRQTQANAVLAELLKGEKRLSDCVKEEDLTALGEEELVRLCRESMEQNQKAVGDILNGKGKAVGALVGYVMKASRGKADSKRVEEILHSFLSSIKNS